MKISASQVTLESQHFSASHSSQSETLRVWVDKKTPSLSSRVRLSEAALNAQAAENSAVQKQAESADLLDPHISILVSIIEMMTGKPVRLFHAAELTSQSGNAPPSSASQAETPNTQATTTNAKAGFGIEYDAQQSYSETEKTSFQATGTINTTDGREISFSLDLQLARSYEENSSVSFRAGDARRKDPLVINFGGHSAQLQNQFFRFDLDADGKQEKIAMLGSGSGYLALDKNANGKIDDGSELLGPQSGSGFADLNKLDSDKNGWIDENDAAFNQLKVWVPSTTGNGELISLKDAGVGALYTGRAATAFELRGNQQQDLGALRETGLYLSENGSVNTLQEVDLTV